MNFKNPDQLLLNNVESSIDISGRSILNKEKFLNVLQEIYLLENLNIFRNRISTLRNSILFPVKERDEIFNINSNKNNVSFKKKHLIEDFNQMLESMTIDRAKYYLKRLQKGVEEVKTSKINDINLNRWKEYEEIFLDSLWVVPKRDSSGVHMASYWGNFIPQIPQQMLLRYTKKGDWVLDTFVGSGTSLIECKKLGRNGMGIELSSEVAQKARDLIDKQYSEFNVSTEIVVGDSKNIDISSKLKNHNIKQVQLLIMHPPYHDIIKFTDDDRDLSNTQSTDDFLSMFGEVVENATPLLEKGRYFALVIGDKYSKGEWIPLGFYCMREVLNRGYTLKSIVIKNFEDTKGKRNQKSLWRYRALVGGFYIFKHEYIFIFKKS